MLVQGAGATQPEPMTVDAARAMLADSSETRERADRAAEEARQAIAKAKAASAKLQGSISLLDDTVAKASSFDEQWEAFQRKFTEMNKMAAQRLAGMMGVATETRRPAEMVGVETVAQVLHRASKVVVLTGAGISAESGIPTFRGADGYWTIGSENYRPQELATWEKYNEMPEELWRWYQYRWGVCTDAKPNPGHYALVELEGLVKGDFTLVTQNIDGLHLEAGSDRQRLFEIHGRIDEMRCDDRVEGSCLHGLDLNEPDTFDRARATCVKTPARAKNEKDERLPCCSACGVRQRPKILWFDECYNEAIYGYKSVEKATEACEVLLIIGTQLTTGLPSRMVQTALSSGATIIKMDTMVDLSDEKSAGMLHLQAKSGEAMPRIISELRKLQQEPSLAPLADSTKLSSALIGKPSSPPADPKMLSRSSSKGTILPPLASAASRGSSAAISRNNASAASRRSSSVASSGRSLANQRKANSAPATPPSQAKTASAKRNSSVPSKLQSAPSTPSKNRPFQNDPGNRSSGSLKAAAAASICNEMGSTADGFFVYGTLRPDDDSGAAWTKAFIEGMESEVAYLSGASLYIEGAYSAVVLEQTRCAVRGAFLRPASCTSLREKLSEADRIEGYPDFYDRSVVMVRTADGASRRAYVYHRTGRADRVKCTRIADGDWLSRKRV